MYYRLKVGSQRAGETFYFDSLEEAQNAENYLLSSYGGYHSSKITKVDKLPEGAKLVKDPGEWL